jgi:16S rRNA (guanine527-N7)-methyltransferase
MEILRQGARGLGLSLTPRHLEQFETYYRELTVWNARFNLTAITGYQEVQRRHFVDSLYCLLAFPQQGLGDTIPDTVPVQRGGLGLRCVDIGTGAGFPGLPLKILLPDMRLTLIESVGKKVTFLQYIVRELGLSGVEIIQGRAEEVAHQETHREAYDIVLARAVAHLAVLAEYCLPFCRLGGRMIAPKGEDAVAETEEAQGAIGLLGGRVVAVKPLTMDEWMSDHYLVVIDKATATPERYPRRTGIPAKRPLTDPEV